MPKQLFYILLTTQAQANVFQIKIVTVTSTRRAK